MIIGLYLINNNYPFSACIVDLSTAFDTICHNNVRVRGSVPGLGGLKETKMFLPHPRVKLSIAGSLRD